MSMSLYVCLCAVYVVVCVHVFAMVIIYLCANASFCCDFDCWLPSFFSPILFLVCFQVTFAFGLKFLFMQLQTAKWSVSLVHFLFLLTLAGGVYGLSMPVQCIVVWLCQYYVLWPNCASTMYCGLAVPVLCILAQLQVLCIHGCNDFCHIFPVYVKA